MTDHQITCPGCGKPLHVPAAAVGKPARCPHCRAAFRLPANPDGSPGVPEPVRRGPGIPRVLVVPGFGLLILGLAGTLVNGYLAARMTREPGFDLEFARGRVGEVRSAEAMSGAMSEPTRTTSGLPLAAPRAWSGEASTPTPESMGAVCAGEGSDELSAVAVLSTN